MKNQNTTIGAIINIVGGVCAAFGYTADPKYAILFAVAGVAIMSVGTAIIGIFAPDAKNAVIDGIHFAEKINEILSQIKNPTVQEISKDTSTILTAMTEAINKQQAMLDNAKGMLSQYQTLKQEHENIITAMKSMLGQN